MGAAAMASAISSHGSIREFYEDLVSHKFDDYGVSGLGLRVRYVSLNDASREARRNWLNRIFDEFEEYEYHQYDTHFCSIAFRNFDAMILGGRDARRLKLILQQNELILRHKVKVCLLSDGTPQERAQLLMAGFDEVIDVARTSPVEALARILSIWRRYGLAVYRNNVVQDEKSRLDAITSADRLNPRQKSALLMLLASAQVPVTYAKLCNTLSLDYDPMSVNCLKVFICSLRKVLRPGLDIRAVTGVGYVLAQSARKRPTPERTKAERAASALATSAIRGGEKVAVTGLR